MNKELKNFIWGMATATIFYPMSDMLLQFIAKTLNLYCNKLSVKETECQAVIAQMQYDVDEMQNNNNSYKPIEGFK